MPDRRLPVALALAALGLAAAAPGAHAAGAPAAPGELVVGYGPASNRLRVHAASAPGPAGRVRVVRGGAADARRLRAEPGVRYVEPNYIYRASALPDDPLVPEQWQDLPSALGLPAAWGISTGTGVTVATIDSGADLSHPDLRENLWTNPREIPGNHVDDDRDGYVDDVHGADILNHDGDPSDDEGHGTHVAGIIAARGNNGLGVAGVAYRARIMPVKVLDSDGSGTVADVARGILYAVAHGARVINVSLNGPGRSQMLEDAIRTATDAGALVVASAGNDGQDIDVHPSYPASYPEDGLLAVAATTRSGRLASYSNRGPRSVDVAAPGDDILSTASDGGYEYRSGTSMAAPATAGVLALLAAARPEDSSAQLRAALLDSARPDAALRGRVGSGAVDAAAALAALGEEPAPAATAERHRARARVRIARKRHLRGGRRRLRWNVRGIDPARVATYRVYVNGRRVALFASASANRPPRRAIVLRLHGGRRYRLKVVAYDRAGRRIDAAARTFRVHHRRARRSR